MTNYELNKSTNQQINKSTNQQNNINPQIELTMRKIKILSLTAIAVCLVGVLTSVQCPTPVVNGSVALVPHKCDCKKFWICSDGEATEQDCPMGLWFCPDNEICDFDHSVGCQYGECVQNMQSGLPCTDEAPDPNDPPHGASMVPCTNAYNSKGVNLHLCLGSDQPCGYTTKGSLYGSCRKP